ncbi:recombinase family protein [Kitasatospora sp. NPDC036755]|uniref:recombinase family protein n=1 Tax=Kitasatospora sp. NPDC036755 TaxID=3154600 RepID=UPI0033E55A54
MTDETKNLLAGTVFTETLRGVRCVRLSVLTDETTSPERQRDACNYVAGELHVDFGQGDTLREAVDLDVSASKTSPWERPELAGWLNDPSTYDALVWWRFDRAIRSMQDMYALANWARANRKVLIFAEGLGGGRQVFDFRNAMDPMAELQLFMLAFAAQFEAQSISDRVTGPRPRCGPCPFAGVAVVARRTATCPPPCPRSTAARVGRLFRTPMRSRSLSALSVNCWKGKRFPQLPSALIWITFPRRGITGL